MQLQLTPYTSWAEINVEESEHRCSVATTRMLDLDPMGQVDLVVKLYR